MISLANKLLRSVLLIVIAAPLISLAMQSCKQTETERTARPAIPAKVYSTWAKAFSRQDILTSIRQTAEGGFIAVGKTSYRMKDPDAWIVKLDAGGNIQWQRGFGEKYVNQFLSVQQTSDKGYLAIGRTMSIKNGEYLGWLVKLDQQGILQWQKTVAGFLPHSFVQSSDDNYVLTGSSNAFSGSGASLVIAKLGPDGRSKWQKVYGEGEGRVIRQTSDGGYVALAAVWGLGRSETLIIKVDGAGTVQWQKQYRGSLNAVEPMTDGGFLLSGAVSVWPKQGAPTEGPLPAFGRGYPPTLGPIPVNKQGWLLRIEREGTAQWQKLYGGVFEDEFTTLSKTGNGEVIVAGKTMNYGSGNGDMWLLLLKENGAIVWQKAIGGPQYENAIAVVTISDGGYLIAGDSGSLGLPGASRSLIVKVDGAGNNPDCTLPAVNASNTAAEDVEIEPGERPFPSQGQDVSLVFSDSAVPSFDLSSPAASFCPPEPKLVLSSTSIKIGPTFNNSRIQTKMRITNVGAADLIVKGMTITEVEQSWLSDIWNFVRGRSVSFSVENDCAKVGPALDCSCIIEFKSSSSGESRAMMTIVSNDPDTPIVTVPIHAIAQ